MDTTQTQPDLEKPARRWWREPLVVGIRHYLEMVIAMGVGMALLGPVTEIIGSAIGAGEILARPDVAALVGGHH